MSSRPWRPLRTGLVLGVLGVLGVLAILGAGCIEIERRIEVTPGAVPAEIDGARWSSLPVSYCIVPDESGFVDGERLAVLVSDAFSEWGVQVESDGECDEVARENNRNEIGWGELEDSGMAAPHEGVYQAGYTRQLFRSCEGGCEGGAESEIVEADILVTSSPPEAFRSEDCLFSTLLHEAGHFLGVPHLASPAVMAPATSECRDGLTEADLAALAELYGDAAEAAIPDGSP